MNLREVVEAMQEKYREREQDGSYLQLSIGTDSCTSLILWALKKSEDGVPIHSHIFEGDIDELEQHLTSNQAT